MNELITEILKREGWDTYTNKASDRGGPTKWGITQKSWSAYIGRAATIDEIKAITEQQARGFYYTEYIVKPNFSLIDDDFVQEFVVDCAVNHGVFRASSWLQEAIGAKVDGRVGPKTLELLRARNPVATLLLLIGIRGRFYAKIASDQLPADPDLPNLRGWINRLMGFTDQLAARIAGG
jgi:lysozyme family protein